MSTERSLPQPNFEPASWDAWQDAAAGGGDLAKLRSRTADGLEVEALYPEAGADAVVPVPTRSCGPWRVGLSYDLETPAAVAQAIALDVEFGLDVAWVKMDGAQRCGGVLGREGGVRFSVPDDLRRLSSSARDCAVWLQAGVGSDELEDAWAKLGTDGGPLYDPYGPLLESGGLGLELDEAIDGALRGVGRRTRSLLVDGCLFHDRGATGTQELGLAVSAVLELVAAAEASGRSGLKTLESVVFRLTMDSDAFASVAKARAARWLMAGLGRRLGSDASPPYLCGRTARRNRTRRDPWVNMLRSTTDAFAGAVGGVDEMLIDPHGAALGEPRADARRWALGAGLLLREESHLTHVADPAAGSGYVEALTRQLAEGAWAVATEVANGGGLARCLVEGSVQSMLADAAAARVAKLHRGRETLTGVSVFPNLDEPAIDVGPAPERPGALGIAPTVVAQRMEPLRLDASFEALRVASDDFVAAQGHRPPALLVVADPPLAARNEFARSLLLVGGFAVQQVTLSELGGVEFVPRVGVLCATDEVLRDSAGELVGRLRAAGVRCVVVAAKPDTVQEGAEHVDVFVHRGVDVPQTMQRLQRAAGVEG